MADSLVQASDYGVVPQGAAEEVRLEKIATQTAAPDALVGTLALLQKVNDTLAAQGAMLAAQGATLASLVSQTRMGSYVFSRVSASDVGRAVDALDINVMGLLRLPDLSAFLPVSELDAFDWGTPEKQERTASLALRPLLDEWVKSGAMPMIENVLLDAQTAATECPLRLSVDEVGTFKGISDAIYLRRNVRSTAEAQPIWNPALISIDWKTPSAFLNTTKIAAIGHIQALAFATARKCAVPVFFSDMMTGFRVWLVIGKSLYHLHPDGGSLTLKEGVALIRFILARLNADCNFCVIDDALAFTAAKRPGANDGGTDGGSSGGATGRATGGVDRDRPESSRGGASVERREVCSVTPSLLPDDEGGDNGEDYSPETLFFQIAAELRERGGIHLDFD